MIPTRRCGDTVCRRDIDERTLTNNVSYSSSDDSVDAHLTPFRRLVRKYEERHGCSQCQHYICFHEPKRWAEMEREAARVGCLGTDSGICDSGQHLQAADQADETAAAWAQPVRATGS